MIKECKMYYCTCDNCNKSHDDYGDPLAYWSKEDAKEAALADGWIESDNKIYCPDCVEYDDKEDCYKPIIED